MILNDTPNNTNAGKSDKPRRPRHTSPDGKFTGGKAQFKTSKRGQGGSQPRRDVAIKELEVPVDASAFAALGLSATVVDTLGRLGYATPTPIQSQAIPHVLSGRDLMGLAQTGTGKTAAFGLPLIEQLLPMGEAPLPKTARSLILAPTRELANQIADNLRSYLRRTHLKINVVVGGGSIGVQLSKLAQGTDILVATPGRLLDIIDRKGLRLDDTRFLVLDEADQMLDLGFIVPLRKIAKMLNPRRQTLLFSATMPKLIDELTKTYLDNPVRVQVAAPGQTADKIRQSVHYVTSQGQKLELLKSCLSANPDGLALVFGRTKHGCEKLKKKLVEFGFKADSIHGNKSQGQRERAIGAFKSGQARILVATDVAARGIDIPGVSHVYNYELPDVPENYVHRIGRTARAGAAGEAVAFCAPDELIQLRDIEKLTSAELIVESGERPLKPTPKPKAARGRPGPRGGEGRKSDGGKPSAVKWKGPRRNRRPDGKGPSHKQAA